MVKRVLVLLAAAALAALFVAHLAGGGGRQDGAYIVVEYHTPNGCVASKTVHIAGGGVANYTDALRICNIYSTAPIAVRLIYRGSETPQPYVKTLYSYWVGQTARGAGLLNGTLYETSDTVLILSGDCVEVGVYLEVEDLADKKAGLLAVYHMYVDISFG